MPTTVYHRAGVKHDVALFVPCFINALVPQVAAAARKVLESQFLRLTIPLDQTCCGQPAFNTGYWREAEQVAGHMFSVFANFDHVVSPSGSCVTMIKNFYPRLFPPGHSRHHEAIDLANRTFEFCTFLVDVLNVEDVGAEFKGTVTMHDACHTLRELGVRDAPRRLLQNVRGLTLVEMDQSETCCGFGGTFATKQAAVSNAMGREKLDFAEASGADTVVTTDSSCLLHIEGLSRKEGRPLRFRHIAEILASNGSPS